MDTTQAVAIHQGWTREGTSPHKAPSPFEVVVRLKPERVQDSLADEVANVTWAYEVTVQPVAIDLPGIVVTFPGAPAAAGLLG